MTLQTACREGNKIIGHVRAGGLVERVKVA